jgi:succinyl-CoA synthetase beta subunit
MDLLEYQAKTLFREVGIPVLPSQPIHSIKDLKDLKIPYPVVLKSQVRRGGRGKAGGVRFAENTIDAIAVAQIIFNLSIHGEYPEILLAEAKYNAEREFYLAITLDRSLRRPVLLGSQQGGIRVASSMKEVQYVVVDQMFSPFYARRLAVKMGLSGTLITTVSEIIEKMYALFSQKDLDLIEINPLAVNAEQHVMALDGKVIVNDNALSRHDDLAQMVAQIPLKGASQPNGQSKKNAEKLRSTSLWGELNGNIAIICNGAGLTMATLDLIAQSGGKPGCFLNLGGETQFYYPLINPNALEDFAIPTAVDPQAYFRLEEGLFRLQDYPQIRVVFLNIFGSFMSCDRIAELLIHSIQRQWGSTIPQFVVRFVGQQAELAKTRLDHPSITILDDFEAAAKQTVKLANPPQP